MNMGPFNSLLIINLHKYELPGLREISQGNKNREAPPVQMGLENTFSLRAKLVWKKDQMYLKYSV